MTNNADQERITKIISEMRALQPRFADIVSRLDKTLTQLEASGNATRLKYSPDYLVKVAYRNAAIKLRLILEQNLTFIETIGVLAVTRYVFEIVVWLKVLDKDSRYGIVFLAQVLEKQRQHLEGHEKKTKAEIALFEDLDKEETRLLHDSVRVAVVGGPDGKRKKAKKIAAALQSVSDEIDRKARRSFSLYWDEAKHNGYGFQAYLLREKGMKQIQTRMDDIKKEEDTLRANCPSEIQRLIDRPWKWFEQAKNVGMAHQYEFLYSYTSRLLHATPVSFFTDQKNLEPPEIRIFLEFVYVSMLDALELAEKKC